MLFIGLSIRSFSTENIFDYFKSNINSKIESVGEVFSQFRQFDTVQRVGFILGFPAANLLLSFFVPLMTVLGGWFIA